MFDFDLQLFGGGGKGGGGSTTMSYTPSAQESRIWSLLAGNADKAQTGISSLLDQYNAGVQSDQFRDILPSASGLISRGQNLIGQSANGEINPLLQQNMADSIRTGVNSTIGSAINNLGTRGVINSSVTNKGLNDISSNVADTMAKSYLSALGTQAQLGNNLIGTANAGYIPYQTLGQMAGNMEGSFLNNAASAMGGKGTSSQTQPSASLGDMLLSTALGLGTAWAGGQMGIPAFK